MNTTKFEKTKKELLIGKSWEYLLDNFHKFTDSNKIKIALALCTKDMPTQMTGEVSYTKMDKVQLNNRLMEYCIDNSTEDIGHPEQADPDNN